MSLFSFGTDRQKDRGRKAERAAPCRYKKRERIAGNVFFALFAAVAMVGTVGYGFNTVLRGPISTMTEVTRRTVAESTVVTSSRLAIVGATTQQTNSDCDSDGMVEPLPFRDPAGAPAPVGGGYLPTDLTPNSIDPWKTEYGYCAWDSGTIALHTDCGSPANRLGGAPDNKQYAIAIISAGKDKTFQTSCIAYDPGNPTASLVVTPDGSDDIVLGYTYAEANDLGAGMWRPDPGNPENMAETRNALEATGSGTFSDAIVLQGNVLTGGGLLLPGDPGDNSLTGPCNMANDRQIRRNTSTNPPSLEICNFSNSANWVPISGTASGGGGGMTGALISHWRLDEESGTIARDTVGGNNGFLQNGPTWTEGTVAGAISFDSNNNSYIRVPRNASLEPNAVSVSMWIRRNGAQPTWAGLLTKTWDDNSAPTHHSYGLYFDGSSDTGIRWQVGHTGGQSFLLYDGIPDNTWTHIVASYDPAATAPQLRLYVNGALVEDGTATDAILYDATSTGGLYIGSTQAVVGERFHGQIDDVRIYSHAITEDTITELFNAGQAGGLRNPDALRKGRMLTWGNNGDGELGIGVTPSNTVYHFPTPVVNGEDFIQIGQGSLSACGLKTGGTVWCWGRDDNGELGNGPDVTTVQTTPTKVIGLDDVVQLSTGATHSCALKRNGEAWCWGAGAAGQIGNGAATAIVDTPTKVETIDDFTYIAAGVGASCGIRQNGEGWCWGGGTAGQLGNGDTTQQNSPVQISNITNWAKIYLSKSHTEHACGVTKDGRAYCWGTETGGNFGNGATSTVQTVPSAVLNSAGSDVWTDWVDIQTTNTTTCGVRADGTGWCWGVDTDGQIGNGGTTTNTRTLPTQVSTYTDFAKISVGSLSACGIRQNRDAVCWGSDVNGVLANGEHITGDQDSPYPTPLKNVLDIAMVRGNAMALIDTNVRPAISEPADIGKLAKHSFGACAIDHDGTAWCWGPNWVGQLGVGDGDARDVPARVADPGPWVQISGHGGTVCAIKADATLWCWGVDDNGILGNGAGVTSAQNAPYQSTDVGPWSRVSVGNGTACGIKADGTAWCWGRLMGTNNASPVQVGTAYRWNSISAGQERYCGITTDGTAMCQGAGENGVLGNGQTAAGNYALAAVLEKGPWIQIYTGTFATCGIKADGTAWCWGAADHGYNWGRVGNGFGQGNFSRPQMVADMGPWAYVTSEYVSCGIKVDGTAWCWGGTDGVGKIGNGELGGSYPYPVRINGDGRWTSIVDGCALKEDRSKWCWGDHGVGNPAASAIEPSPYRTANFPHPNPWMATQDNGGVNLRRGVGVEIGTQRNISAAGAANTGIRLGNDGRMTAEVAAGNQQFMIESAADTFAAQLTLKSASVLGVTPPAGIVAWWRLDEAAGTHVSDALGNSHGTSINGPTWAPSGGVIDGALSFTAASDHYVRVPRSASLEPNAVSVSMWIRRDGAQDYMANIISKTWDDNSAPTYESYSLQFNAASDTELMWLIGYNGGYHSITYDGIPNNEWAHIVASYDPAATAPQMRLYVNGLMVTSGNYTNPILYDTTSAGDIYIGAEGTATSQNFNGQIDDVQIYSRALSDEEIQNIYNNSIVRPALMRTIGADSTTGTLKVARDGTGSESWLRDLRADLEVTPAGNVGIGTGGSPQAKLDVRGAIKIGDDGGGCTAGKAGTIQWTGTEFEYCDGTWQPLISGGGGTPWEAHSITGGRYFSCATQADGTAWCWGDGVDGALGNGSTSDQLYATQVQTETGPGVWTDWVDLSAQNWHSCGIRVDGSAWCWGGAWPGVLGFGQSWGDPPRPVRVQTDTGPGGWNDWQAIASGGYHTCGIRVDGSAWCWGGNWDGQLGDGSSAPETTRPVRVQTDTGPGGWNDWTKIAAGEGHACGIRVDGSMWCWGSNGSGQMGDGSTTNRDRPVRVQTDTGPGGWSDWVDLTVGEGHACGIRRDGSGWCWGNNGERRLGDGTDTSRTRPVRVQTDTGPGGWNDWVSIRTGIYTTCGIRADGSGWCWGNNGGGRLGDGTDTSRTRPVRVQTDTGPGGWNDWVEIQAFYEHSCGVRANGTLWCWGGGSEGKLGNGAITDHSRPVQVEVAP